MQLKKSDIESVILAGSSLSRRQGPNLGFDAIGHVHGARSARFFSDFDVLAAENPKISPFTLGWRDKRLRVWG